MMNCRTITVKALPESVTLRHMPKLVGELVPLIQDDWPCLVLDLSNVSELDRAGVELLLRIVEEVIKRNGDVKLAAVPPAVAVILEMTRVDRLFESYDDPADAVASFGGISTASVAQYSAEMRP